jgi:RNA polymerase-binding protein DksA
MSRHDAVRTQLEQRLTQLTKRVAKIEADLRKPQNPDWPERAVETENDEVLEGLDASTADEVTQIQQALGRIDDGTYGQCASCGKPIGDGRLSAMPHATTCINCAS